jgi:hypothetical protein
LEEPPFFAAELFFEDEAFLPDDFFAVDAFFDEEAFFVAPPFFDADFFDEEEDFFDEVFRDGTLSPSARASEIPIAMACLRLFTFAPEPPLFSFPSPYSCITFEIFFCAFAPYLVAMRISFTRRGALVCVQAAGRAFSARSGSDANGKSSKRHPTMMDVGDVPR